MGSIRDIKRFIEAGAELAHRVPLRKAKNVVLGDPQVPSKLGITTASNTVIPVAYDNRKYAVPYNRKDIQTFIAPMMLPGQYVVLTSKHKTTLDVLPEINRKWGLELKPAEVVDEPIAVTTVADKSTFAIKMSPACIWFTGTLQVPVWPMSNGAHIVPWTPRLITPMPKVQPTRKLLDAAVLTHSVDYSAASAACAAVYQVPSRATWNNGNNAQQAALATAIAAIDKLPWVASATLAAYNLQNSHCIYNGPTEGFKGGLAIASIDGVTAEFTTDSYIRYDRYVNTAMSKVLILVPNTETSSLNVGGALFIHYGGPVEQIPEVPYRGPVHNWPLNGDLKNTVPGKPDLTLPVTWAKQRDGSTRPRLTAVGNYPLGVTLPSNADYTLTITLGIRDNANQIQYGILGVAAGGQSPGVIGVSSTSVYVMNASPRWIAPNGVAEPSPFTDHIVTIVRRGLTYRTYANGELVSTGDVAQGVTLGDLTHFGKTADVYPIKFPFYNFSYYDYAMSDAQVAKLARGEYVSN